MELILSVLLTSALDGHLRLLTALFPVSDVHCSLESVIGSVVRITVYSAGILWSWDEGCPHFEGLSLKLWCPLHHTHFKAWGVIAVVAAPIFSLRSLMVCGWAWCFRWPQRQISKGMMSRDLGGHLISSVPSAWPGKTSHSFLPSQYNEVVLYLAQSKTSYSKWYFIDVQFKHVIQQLAISRNAGSERVFPYIVNHVGFLVLVWW